MNDRKRPSPLRPSRNPDVRKRGLAMMAAGELNMADIAKFLGVNEDTLRRWKREEEPQPPKNITPAVYIKNYRWFNTKW